MCTDLLKPNLSCLGRMCIRRFSRCRPADYSSEVLEGPESLLIPMQQEAVVLRRDHFRQHCICKVSISHCLGRWHCELTSSDVAARCRILLSSLSCFGNVQETEPDFQRTLGLCATSRRRDHRESEQPHHHQRSFQALHTSFGIVKLLQTSL